MPRRFALLVWLRHCGYICGLTVVLVAAVGCTLPSTSDCSIPGVGTGRCCVLRLPGRITEQGLCRNESCVNGKYEIRTEECGSSTTDDALISVPPDAFDSSTDGSTDGPMSVSDAAGLDSGQDAGDSGACMAVVCAADEVCHPPTGACRSRSFGRPGGPCRRPDDCAVGECRAFDVNSDTPGGYCHQPCAVDGDCGGGVCANDEGEPVCRRRCNQEGQCLGGWTCYQQPGVDPPGMCIPDCRQLGCPGQRACDAASGRCIGARIRCVYPCRAGEACEQGRCVRADGTCVTTYHCVDGDICVRGQCMRDDATPCVSVDECSSPEQRCVPTGENIGHCALRCEVDGECPIHQHCDPRVDACLYRRCGDGTGNGDMYGVCQGGPRDGIRGTCLPFFNPERNGDGPPVRGYCHEGGIVGLSEPCDEQSQGRTPDDRALQCRAGAACIGDPDDSLEPLQSHPGRGRCHSVCWPEGESCGETAECVRIGPRDDPATPGNEAYPVAVCLASDCRIFDNVCPMGQVCRPYSLWSVSGRCTAPGPIRAGGACETAADCAGSARCVRRASGRVCMPLCLPEMVPCQRGQCGQDPTWAYGLCATP